jgi:hypothetical protein
MSAYGMMNLGLLCLFPADPFAIRWSLRCSCQRDGTQLPVKVEGYGSIFGQAYTFSHLLSRAFSSPRTDENVR